MTFKKAWQSTPLWPRSPVDVATDASMTRHNPSGDDISSAPDGPRLHECNGVSASISAEEKSSGQSPKAPALSRSALTDLGNTIIRPPLEPVELDLFRRELSFGNRSTVCLRAAWSYGSLQPLGRHGWQRPPEFVPSPSGPLDADGSQAALCRLVGRALATSKSNYYRQGLRYTKTDVRNANKIFRIPPRLHCCKRPTKISTLVSSTAFDPTFQVNPNI